MSRPVDDIQRRLLRARDAMDRSYAEHLDIAMLARIACLSEAHFIRSFHATFGETPHRFLQLRRLERAMFLLRESDRSVADICRSVGFTSIGTFGRTFKAALGQSPLDYRRTSVPWPATIPACFVMAWSRPR